MRYALAALTIVVFVLQIPFIYYMNPAPPERPAQGRDYPAFLRDPEAPTLANVVGETQPAYEYDAGMPKLGDGIVRGVVTDREGAPVADAEVRIERRRLGADALLTYHASAPTWAMATDARGLFLFRDLPPGAFLARAAGPAGHALAAVTLRENGPAGELLLALRPSQVIAGVVAARHAEPVEDARVFPIEHEKDTDNAALYRCAPAFTEWNGRFVLRHLPAGRWRLLVTARNHTPTLTGWVETRAPDASGTPVNIALAAGTPLRGAVRDADSGTPLSGVKVQAVEDAYGAERYSTRTGPNGAFRFKDVRPAAYRLEIVSERYVRVSGPEVVGPVSGDDGQDPPVVEVRRGGSVRGRVTLAEDNAPAAGASVWLDAGGRRTVETDNAGYYRFTALPAGAAAIGVTPPSGCLAPAPVQVDITLGERTAGPDFALERGAALRGRVTDDTGAPVAFANVFVSTHPSADPAQATHTDSEGGFGFDGLPEEGDLWCWAEKLGWGSTLEGPVTPADASATPVALELTEEVGLQTRRYE